MRVRTPHQRLRAATAKAEPVQVEVRCPDLALLHPEHPIDHKIELCCFCILFYGLFLFLWSVFTDLNYGLFLLWLFVSWIEKNTQTLIKAFSDVNTVFSHTQVSILLDDKY
jgi:hypothetical protein